MVRFNVALRPQRPYAREREGEREREREREGERERERDGQGGRLDFHTAVRGSLSV